MNDDFFSCPYPDCDGVTRFAPGSILFCDRCASPVLFCRYCQADNQVWAGFCRACGKAIENRRDIIARDHQSFLDTWKLSRGLFYEKPVPGSSAPGWRGRLVGIDGSYLVFGGTQTRHYSDLFLAHPHRQTHTLLNLIGPGSPRVGLSGNAVITDRHLLLGSDEALIRIALAAIYAPPEPYKLDRHRHDYVMKCECLAFLSQDRVLLGERLGDSRIRFTIRDVDNKTPSDPMEVDAHGFSVSEGRLFVVSASEIEIYNLHLREPSFERIGSLPLDGLCPRSSPLAVHGSLYLIASTNPGTLKSMLVKWDMRYGGISGKQGRVLREDYMYRLASTGARLVLWSAGGVSLYDSHQDRAIFNLTRNTYTSLGPGIVGRVLALPIITSLGYSYVEVVNDAGQTIFQTEAFSRIFPDIVVWSRFLFVLGRRDGDNEVQLYGYDLAG